MEKEWAVSEFCDLNLKDMQKLDWQKKKMGLTAKMPYRWVRGTESDFTGWLYELDAWIEEIEVETKKDEK